MSRPRKSVLLAVPPPCPEIPADATARPFLKWAGGKGRLLEQFERFLPPTLKGRGYVEPFVGSGAVFFHVVRTRRPARVTLLDANPGLIGCYRWVRDDVEALIARLVGHHERHNGPGVSAAQRKAYYYAVRDENPSPDSLEGAARFIYLNKTCFNGLHRLNSKGRFNVPMGDYENPPVCDPGLLRAASSVLQGVTIEVADFRVAENRIADGDFVYLDPPYEPLSKTSSFTAYAKDGFTGDDQGALRDMLARLSARCQWMLSNSTAPLIEALYDQPGMYKHTVSAARAINSKASARGRILELVVTSYPVGG